MRLLSNRDQHGGEHASVCQMPKATSKVKLAPTDSIVGEVEPAAIGRMLDEMEQQQNAADLLQELAREEDVESWSSLIRA